MGRTKKDQPAAEASKINKHSTPAQIMAVITWIEDDSNFSTISGNFLKCVIDNLSNVGSNKRIPKTKGFETLGKYVTNLCPNDPWDGVKARSRFESILIKYKRVKKESESTGYGVFTDQDIKEGYSTISSKKERDCLGFARLHAVLGSRQNIQPGFLIQTTNRELVIELSIINLARCPTIYKTAVEMGTLH